MLHVAMLALLKVILTLLFDLEFFYSIIIILTKYIFNLESSHMLMKKHMKGFYYISLFLLILLLLSVSYGHTILDIPDPIRTLKSSRIGPS